MEEKEILKELVVSEEDVRRRLKGQVERAKKIFEIEAGSGKIYFKNYTALSGSQLAAILLCGKYFATKLGYKVKYPLGPTEITEEIHKPPRSLGGKKGALKFLRQKGWIEKDPHGKYKVVPYFIDKILADAEKKMPKG